MELLTPKQREEVQKKYPTVTFPDPVLEPLWFGRRPEKMIEDKFAIVDQKSNTVFAICSDQYKIVYYEDILNITEQAFKEVQKTEGKIQISPRPISNGGKFVIDITLIDRPFEIKKGDIVNPRISIKSSYDLQWKFIPSFGAFRVVCSNGATAGILYKKMAKRHVQTLDPTILVDFVKEGMDLYTQQISRWKQWAKAPVPEVLYNEILTSLSFSTKEKEKIEKLKETASGLALEDKKWRDQINLWDFHNVLTQYATHEVKSDLRKIDLQDSIASVFDSAYLRTMTHYIN